MTVSSTTRKAGPYSGNGVTVAFPFAFKVFAAADVLVVLTDADGVEVEQVLNSDYTIALNADQNANPGGTITMLSAPATGYRVTATSQVENLQPTDITNNGGFYPEVLESAHDRAVIQIQQLTESVNRSMVMPLSSDLSSFQLTEGATAAGRALRVIGFDASGDPTLLDSSDNSVLRGELASYVASNGASLVGFLQGGTGAVGVTVRQKMQEVGSVDDFGPVGDGAADDTAELQAALDWVGASRGRSLRLPHGKRYRITAPLIFRPASLPAALSGSDLHFSDVVGSRIYAEGDARIVAGAAMTRMLLVQFNSVTSSVAPYNTVIEGICFDGNSLADRAIESDYALHLTIRKNRIWRVVSSGVYFIGYGVARIYENVIKAPICINLAEGGGDTAILTNDFYPLANGRGVSLGKSSGNTVMRDNIFSGEGAANTYGVYIDGTTGLSTDIIRNVRVFSNEFSGMAAAVFAQRHAGGRNIYGITVRDNHTTPAAGGAVHTGALVNFDGVDDSVIADNYINGIQQAATISVEPGIQLTDCQRPRVAHNKFGNLLGPAMYLQDVVRGKFLYNEIQDVGRAGAGGAIVDVDTGCTSCVFKGNDVYQTNVAFAQNSLIERAGANGNEFSENTIIGANPVAVAGATSVSTGRVVASGRYTVSGGVASLLSYSTGFTVSRTAAGTVTVTFATARPNAHYLVKVVADTPQAAVDTPTTTSFVVKTYDAAGVLTDPLRVHIEVTD